MGGKPRPSCPPEAILAGHPARVVALANRARRQIAGMIDGVRETGHPGRKLIGLHRHGTFGFIQPMRDHIRIGFEHGASLPDFAGLLEGEGARVRHVTVRTARQLESFGVKTLLSAALFDDETHTFRRQRR